MNTARKLISESEQQIQQPSTIATADTRLQNIIKLAIVVLLTYVIIFM